MDSVDEGGYGIPGSNARIEGDCFLADFPLFGADLDVRRDGDALVGFFNHRSIASSITLMQVEIVPPSRPQEEALVRDYEIQQVEFAGGEDGVMLAGELTMPSDGGPFPGLVLITGTGEQNRDEELLKHKPFLILSDHLTRNGFAVLRYDDRGFGESSGDFATATTEDFAADAAAALAFLRAQSRVDPERVGYVGHSEGALIAPIATQVEQAQFMVLLAGPTQKLVDVMVRQARDIGAADEASELQLQAQEMMQRLIFQAVREAESPEAAREAALQVLISAGLPPAAAEAQVSRLASPWFMWLMDYDPVPALEAFAGPVLALYGEKDLAVAPGANAPAMEAALSDPASSVQTLTGLNHVFQPAESGSPSEYHDIETTFDPRALMIISDWLTDVTTP
jgi:pimeloyl-ACP methyl ester carboxylesterase